MSEGRLLLIDTAGPVVGVAAFDGERLVYAEELRIVNGADGWLSPRIAEALAALGRLDRLAVSTGPGAFTGLRVGVASALGVAMARGAPVVGLCSLALRAAAVPGHGNVLGWLDARKDRVYARRFDTRGPLPVALTAAEDVAPGDAARVEPGVATGEGAVVYRDVLESHGHAVAAHAAVSPARHGAALAWAAQAVAPEALTLAYVRPPDAVPLAER